MAGDTNGRRNWLIGVLAGCVITGMTAWAANQTVVDNRLDDRLTRVALRTSASEARISGIESSFVEIRTQLNLVHQELSIIRQELRDQWRRK